MGEALGFGIPLVLVLLGITIPLDMWLRERRDRKWADVEADHWSPPRPRMGRRRPEPRFPVRDAPPAMKFRYLIGSDSQDARAVYLSWAEVKELAAEKSGRGREVYVSREEGGVVRRWMWRNGMLIRHWSE